MINIDDRILMQCDESELFFMLHVAKHMSKDMTAFPKNATLCQATKWGLNKLQRVKKRCIKKGLIEVSEQRNGGFQIPNLYKVKTSLLSVFINLKDKGDAHTPKQGRRIPQNGVGSIPQNGVTEVLTIQVLDTVDSNESTDAEAYTFPMFWEQYAHKKGQKAKACERFNKLNLADRQAIQKTLPFYLRDTVTKDTGRKGEFKPMRKHPERYLSGRIWEAYLDTLAETESEDSKQTDFDGAYQRYLDWTRSNFPHVISDTKHMSKQQFIEFKSTYYVPGKSIMSTQTELNYLTDAHRKLETDSTARHSWPDVFSLHCEYVKQCVKSHDV